MNSEFETGAIMAMFGAQITDPIPHSSSPNLHYSSPNPHYSSPNPHSSSPNPHYSSLSMCDDKQVTCVVERDGEVLCGSEDGTMSLHDIESGKLLSKSIDCGDSILSMALVKVNPKP